MENPFCIDEYSMKWWLTKLSSGVMAYDHYNDEHLYIHPLGYKT